MSRCCASWSPRSTAKQILQAAKLPKLKHVVVLDDGPHPRGARLFSQLMSLAGPGHRGRLDGLSAALDPATPSISSSPAARPDRPKGRRSPISTSSTMHATRRRRWRSSPRIVCAFRCRSIIVSAWCWACSPVPRSAPAWFSPARVSMLRRRSRRWRATNAQRCTASRPCSSPSSSIRTSRTTNFDAADRHHGRRAVPDRHHARGHRPHAHARGHDRLGMTETSPLSFQSRTDDPIDRRVSTVGRILPHVEVKIVDATARSRGSARRANCHARLRRHARLLGRSRAER